MADNITFQTTLASPPDATVVSTDDCGASGHIQRIKLAYSADGTATHVTADADGLLVNLGTNNDVTITSGTITTVSTVTAVTTVGTITNAVAVTDNSGSLTVDAPVGTPVFVRLSDGSSAITTLPVSLASVPSHAVTNAGTFAVQAAQSGTWTVDLGATDNAVLDAIAASLAGTLTVGSHAVTNAGTFAVQVDGSALTALQLIDDCIFTDDGAFTPGTSKVAVIGAQADNTATDSVDEGDAGALRMTLDRKLLTAAELESNAVRIAGVATTPLFAAISVSSSGNNQIVAADATKKIRVLKWSVSASAAVNVKWRTASTDLTGLFYLPAAGGVATGALCHIGHFETVANEALNLNLSGAVAVGGYVVYILV